ncbi:MAG: hypothetical protein F6J97_13885 [Leptolyngbya sp. SIO4C1]|nr:hypothetical protein [Leptolyngbya sp. SIO4C1]
MNEPAYFSFTANEQRFSINAAYVEAVFALPDIILLPEAAPDIVGALNLRGELIPILDLNISLGRAAADYQVSDSLIVLNQNQLRAGVIASTIHELEAGAVAATLAEATGSFGQLKRKHLIAGLAQDDAQTIVLAGPDRWLQYVEVQQVISMASLLGQSPADEADEADEARSQRPTFLPEASATDRLILQQRAGQLRQPLQRPTTEALKTLSVVMLGGQRFGIDLTLVQEFVEASNLTPVPCCPETIVGNLNLRGDVLTVVDIRSLLDLPIAPPAAKAQIIVVEVDAIAAGIVVEQILDSMFLLNQQAIVPVERTASRAQAQYLEGMATYEGSLIGLLNLPKLIAQGNLIVDEVV